MPGGDAAESPGRRDRRPVPVMPPTQAALKVPLPDGLGPTDQPERPQEGIDGRYDASPAMCALGACRLGGRSVGSFGVESFPVVLSTIWPAQTFTV
jgi:hypothetical protein